MFILSCETKRQRCSKSREVGFRVVSKRIKGCARGLIWTLIEKGVWPTRVVVEKCELNISELLVLSTLINLTHL